MLCYSSSGEVSVPSGRELSSSLLLASSALAEPQASTSRAEAN